VGSEGERLGKKLVLAIKEGENGRAGRNRTLPHLNPLSNSAGSYVTPDSAFCQSYANVYVACVLCFLTDETDTTAFSAA
jgi:hypothetical protein